MGRERTRRRIPCEWAVGVEWLGTVEPAAVLAGTVNDQKEVGLDPSRRESSCATGVRAVVVGRGVNSMNCASSQ